MSFLLHSIENRTMKENKNRLVSRTEAADILGVTPQTISNYIERGVFKEHRVGKMVMLDGNTIREVLDTQKDINEARCKLREIRAEIRAEQEKEENILNSFKMQIVGNVDKFAEEPLLSAFIKVALPDHLSMRNLEFFKRYALKGESIESIADKFMYSRERVRQIIGYGIRALSELKNYDSVVEENMQLKQEIETLRYKNAVMKKAIAAEEVFTDEIFKTGSSAKYKEQISIIKRPLKGEKVSGRLLNICYGADVETIGELASMTKKQFLEQRNCGQKTLYEAIDLLEKYGFKFGEAERIEELESRYVFASSL